jgi:hypothetical protein
MIPTLCFIGEGERERENPAQRSAPAKIKCYVMKKMEKISIYLVTLFMHAYTMCRYRGKCAHAFSCSKEATLCVIKQCHCVQGADGR